jgi:spermidine/putrescine transport system substrate-binding protein
VPEEPIDPRTGRPRLRPQVNRSLSRRAFLVRTAAGAVAVPYLAAFLEACSKSPSSTGGGTVPTFSVASPDHPVTWDIAKDNQPIKSGLTPEQGAVVNIYTYVDYVDPAALKSFAKKYKKYGLTARITTFEDTTEAIGKIRSGGVQADIYNPSYDQIGKLVAAKLIQPLNHDYLTNIANVWPEFQNPWYDQGWRYTTPYMIYTTGITWRIDKHPEDVSTLSNPWDSLWDTKYARKVSVLDDYRTCMGMVAIKNGMSMNTTKSSDLQTIKAQLTQLNQTMKPKVNVSDYQDLPTNVVSICQAWSGDAVNMPYYMPTGQDPKVLRYWTPPDGKGPIDNDLMVALRASKNPVATHLFLNHLMDYNVAIGNFGAVGYQPPQVRLTPDNLVKDEYVPANLKSAVVLPQNFETGARILELAPADDAAWQAIWQQFKAGA